MVNLFVFRLLRLGFLSLRFCLGFLSGFLGLGYLDGRFLSGFGSGLLLRLVGGLFRGRLDWLFYSPDQLTLQRSFALWTPDMPADVLAAVGLHASDSRASDHLALVADFTFEPESPESR